MSIYFWYLSLYLYHIAIYLSMNSWILISFPEFYSITIAIYYEAKISPDGKSSRNPFILVPLFVHFMTSPHLFWEQCLTFWYNKMFILYFFFILYFLCTDPGISHFRKDQLSFWWSQVTEWTGSNSQKKELGQ